MDFFRISKAPYDTLAVDIEFLIRLKHSSSTWNVLQKLHSQNWMHASFSEILGATKIYQDGHKFAKSERKIYKKRKFDLMVAFITWNSNLVPLLEGLCSSNPCRFESSVFWVLARIEPTTSGSLSWNSATATGLDTFRAVELIKK